MATDASLTVLRVQTDRTAFLGRGRTIYAPRALEMPISAIADTLGDVIEPCLSLRGQFVLPSGGRLQFVFATLLPGENEAPGAFLERYGQVGRRTARLRSRPYARAGHSALSGAFRGNARWGFAPGGRAVLHRPACPAALRIGKTPCPSAPCGAWASAAIFPFCCWNAARARICPLVQLLLKAHAWYRMHGLWVEPGAGRHPAFGLRTSAARTARRSGPSPCHSHELIGKESGVHLFDSLTADQLGLFACRGARGAFHRRRLAGGTAARPGGERTRSSPLYLSPQRRMETLSARSRRPAV